MPYSVPRATHCGHIFCFGCILFYLRQQDSEYVKCPMCSEYIDAASLRPVTLFPARPRVKEGVKTTMELVVRRSHCINAFSVLNPRLHYYLSTSIPNADAPLQDIQFCHLLMNTPFYEVSRIEEELQQLRTSESEMDSAGEVLLKGIVVLVRDQLQARLSSLTTAGVATDQQPIPLDSELSEQAEESFPDLLYYYTIPSNLSYHLLPLSFQCLRSFYGGLSCVPPFITASVLQIEDIELSADHQGRNAVLHHMPSYSILHYVELNVCSIIPGRIEASLFESIIRREQARKKAKQQMKREARRIQVVLHVVIESSNASRRTKRSTCSSAFSTSWTNRRTSRSPWTL